MVAMERGQCHTRGKGTKGVSTLTPKCQKEKFSVKQSVSLANFPDQQVEKGGPSDREVKSEETSQ